MTCLLLIWPLSEGKCIALCVCACACVCVCVRLLGFCNKTFETRAVQQSRAGLKLVRAFVGATVKRGNSAVYVVSFVSFLGTARKEDNKKTSSVKGSDIGGMPISHFLRPK